MGFQHRLQQDQTHCMLGSANGEKGLALFLDAWFGEKVVGDVL